ncbi:hypothetical protein M758_4G107600 [Ceratodon purpureus]|nr:hypothetical protein M758_4G107600 [Ceratodon purpureus]
MTKVCSRSEIILLVGGKHSLAENSTFSYSADQHSEIQQKFNIHLLTSYNVMSLVETNLIYHRMRARTRCGE